MSRRMRLSSALRSSSPALSPRVDWNHSGLHRFPHPGRCAISFRVVSDMPRRLKGLPTASFLVGRLNALLGVEGSVQLEPVGHAVVGGVE